MCRIAGFWDQKFNNDYELDNTIAKMNATLKHGGPDDDGFWTDSERGLALANCRLSILDLSPLGHQPMFSPDKNLALVFNGEIYNFAAIKQELFSGGFLFKSHSDTEVILAAYQKWGMKCLEKFRGMFAFALFDKKQETLFLARDRLGVKPLYYFWDGSLLMFVSETRALLKHPHFYKQINPEALAAYFQFGYIPNSLAIWESVFKVEPGCYLKITQPGSLEQVRYWDAQEYYFKGLREPATLSFDEAADKLEQILLESFQLRMVSDVPVGVFLSGGIDSSLVATLLQKNSTEPLRTFTIGFEEKEYNEAGHAKKIADYLGTKHTEVFCRQSDALKVVEQLPEIYDEPFGDSSAVPTFLVTQQASQHLKVVLSGDGGDEFFAGYNKYWRIANYLRYWRHNRPTLFSEGTLGRWPFGLLERSLFYRWAKWQKVITSPKVLNRFLIISSCFLKEEIKQLIKAKRAVEWERIDSFPLISRELYQLDLASLWMLYDTQHYLAEDILTKGDRASMHNALELREPLLDHQILEFAATLPISYKCNKSEGKLILKKILAKHLPQEYWDRPKQGFSIPMAQWLRNELKPLVMEVCSENNIEKHGLLDYGSVKRTLDAFYQNKNSNAFKIWYLLVFQLWTNKWL